MTEIEKNTPTEFFNTNLETNKKKVLLIDDDSDLTEAASMVLESDNFKVQTLDTTKNAEIVVSNYKPDLIILDVMFPENPIGGFELCHKLKTNPETTHIPVILFSAINAKYNAAFSEDFSNGSFNTEISADMCLEKPINPCVMLKVANQLTK